MDLFAPKKKHTDFAVQLLLIETNVLKLIKLIEEIQN